MPPEILNPLILFPCLLVFCCLYYLVPQKFRWIVLLVASYGFFYWVGQWTLLILVLATLINYAAGVLLASQKTKSKNFILAGTIIIDIVLLVFFKYFVSLLSPDSTLYRLMSSDAGTILFPVGLSFYTLQNISYLIDISSGLIPAEKNPGVFAAFLAFFPKIIAGPVERGKNLIPQLRMPESLSRENLVDGARMVLLGLFYKVVIADRLALFVNEVFKVPGTYQGRTLFFTLIFLSFQIYLDFAGYTNIALGVAKMLGIRLTENFKRPYLAVDIMEFWNRWHISFSTWLRDYIFFPLRYKLLRRKPFISEVPALIIPPLVTMTLSGLWHGTGLTFLVWGLYHAFFYTINVVLKNRKGASKKKPHLLVRIFAISMNFLMLSIAWVIFKAETMTQALGLIYNLVLKGTTLVLVLKNTYNLDFLLSCVFVFLIFTAEVMAEVNPKRFGYNNLPFMAKAVIITFMILCLTIFGVYTAEGSTFIYGKF